MVSAHRPIPAAGAVMAGGRSRRFGFDKALLTIEGETLLARAVRVLADVCFEQLVIGPPERRTQTGAARLVFDQYPGSGPLGGILTALQATAYDRVLAVACDMPFLDAGLLRHLLELSPNVDVVLPRVGGRSEPLHAVYSARCLEPIRRHLTIGQFKVDGFFDEVRVLTVDEDELRRYDPALLSFRNVNTIKEWNEAQSLIVH